MKLVMSNPAEAASTKPSATCPTIRVERSQSRLEISVRPPSLSDDTNSVFDAVIDGTLPDISPDTDEIARTNARTRRSTPACAARGMVSPTSDNITGVQAKARQHPANPPAV